MVLVNGFALKNAVTRAPGRQWTSFTPTLTDPQIPFRPGLSAPRDSDRPRATWVSCGRAGRSDHNDDSDPHIGVFSWLEGSPSTSVSGYPLQDVFWEKFPLPADAQSSATSPNNCPLAKGATVRYASLFRVGPTWAPKCPALVSQAALSCFPPLE